MGAANAPAQASAVSPAQTQFVSANSSDSNRSAAALPTDAAMPQPKSTVTNVNQKLLIPPGPRNPVGLCWIALSLPGYGIHGTPTPEMIGKTGSHGCFRLTNWDAQRLGGMVDAGMIVEFVK
jgi:lipoprotein-anchoring transpeptidase ErfK/SrfK